MDILTEQTRSEKCGRKKTSSVTELFRSEYLCYFPSLPTICLYEYITSLAKTLQASADQPTSQCSMDINFNMSRNVNRHIKSSNISFKTNLSVPIGC